MDIQVISQLIGSLGFPIVCCIVMFYQNGKLQATLSELTQTLVSMNERIKDIEDKIEG